MKKRAFLYIVLAGILWGTSGIFVYFLRPYGFSPIQMTAMRSTVSVIVMGLYMLLSDPALFKASKKELVIFALSGVAVFFTATCYYASIQASSVSVAVVLMYTAPVFVMAYSVAFLGERLTPLKLASVAMVIVGCALVSGIFGSAKFSLLGAALGLASGVAYSAYNVFTKIEMMQGSNSVSASFYSFVFMSAVSLSFCDAPKMAELTARDPVVVLALMLGIGVLTCVLPYFLYTLALKDIPVGTASALGIIEPMSATVFSVAFLNEKLGIVSFCGIVLILAAVFILNKSEGREQKNEA